VIISSELRRRDVNTNTHRAEEPVVKTASLVSENRKSKLVARMEEMRNAHKILVKRPEGKRPLGRLEKRGSY
jgi:hypothetical protein